MYCLFVFSREAFLQTLMGWYGCRHSASHKIGKYFCEKLGDFFLRWVFGPFLFSSRVDVKKSRSAMHCTILPVIQFWAALQLLVPKTIKTYLMWDNSASKVHLLISWLLHISSWKHDGAPFFNKVVSLKSSELLIPLWLNSKACFPP